MNDRYDELRIEPDRDRAQALRTLLHAQLAAAPSAPRGVLMHSTDSDDDSTKEINVSLETPQNHKRNGRLLALVASVAVVGIAGLAFAISTRDADETDAASEPKATQPNTTLPPLTDAEIAEATLLTPKEFGDGWFSMVLNGTVPWGADLKMDSSIAAQVDEYAPYLDAAFESPTRAAVADYKFFNTTYPAAPAPTPEYVVVFPDETAAAAMFDAVTSPGFVDQCVSGYGDAIKVEPPFSDPDFVWFPF